jgi:hypothetical protein
MPSPIFQRVATMTDEHLDGLSKLVHEALKRLKMGDSGVISCSKEYKQEEVMLYARAYGVHKHKWFEIEYDKTTNIVRAKRAPIPPKTLLQETDEEEVE